MPDPDSWHQKSLWNLSGRRAGSHIRFTQATPNPPSWDDGGDWWRHKETYASARVIISYLPFKSKSCTKFMQGNMTGTDGTLRQCDASLWSRRTPESGQSEDNQGCLVSLWMNITSIVDMNSDSDEERATVGCRLGRHKLAASLSIKMKPVC